MRMDDLDGPRVQKDMIAAALRDLEWLGLDWDGPMLLQSDRLPRLREAVSELLARGLAYPCVCSRGELRMAQSAPHAGEGDVRYPGTCRDRFASLDDAKARTGRDAAVRLKVSSAPVVIDDGVAGRRVFDVDAEVGDFPIARRDGAPAYQLAAAVDDAEQGITEVLRGDDLLSSAARQRLVQDALGLPHPRYLHVPLVLDADGRRLAKRTDALSLWELRQRGVDPRAIVAWVARSAGLDVGARASAAEVLAKFDLRALPREPVRLPASVDSLFE